VYGWVGSYPQALSRLPPTDLPEVRRGEQARDAGTCQEMPCGLLS
jgi:hypothetical protein